MEANVLSAKLTELDRTLAALHGKLADSQKLDSAGLHREISVLRQQSGQSRAALHEKMLQSRAPFVNQLDGIYTEIERLVTDACAQAAAKNADEQLLLAEYALDFALQAAGQAALLALQAIETQKTQEEPAI